MTLEGWCSRGRSASRKGGCPLRGGSAILCLLVRSHLTLAGASYHPTSFCPNFVPCFQTFIEHLPCAQLGAGHRNYSEKQDRVPALESQEAPDNRKCW